MPKKYTKKVAKRQVVMHSWGMNRERIQTIINGLRTVVKPEKFNMSQIGNPTHPCGSAGCVMGWMPALFPEEGFETKRIPIRSCLSEEVYVSLRGHSPKPYLVNTLTHPTRTPVLTGLFSTEIVLMAEFLNLGCHEVHSLFHGGVEHAQEKPEDTARRLEEYLETGVAK